MAAGSSRFDLFGRIVIQGAGTAVANLGRVGQAFAGLRAGVAGARQMASGVSQLASSLAILGSAATAGLGYAVKKATDFEYAMSGVYAVLATEEGKYNDQLTYKAKQLGMTTRWTATEVAQAMEELARSGYGGMEVYEGIPGILNMAAAEGMNLARATMYTASTLRAFGMEAKETQKVADLLAAASVSSATNIEGIGNALRYVGGTAGSIGMSLDDTLLTIGLVANQSLRGSIGGTSFNQALTQMIKSASKANGPLQKLGVNVKDVNGNFIGMGGPNGVVMQLTKALEKYTGKVDKAAILSEIFNVRGARSVNALVKAFDVSVEAQKQSLDKLTYNIAHASDGIGMAAKMAQTKLENVKGATIILLSALESTAIETFHNVRGTIKDEVRTLSGYISDLGNAMMYLNTKADKLTDEQKTNWGKLSETTKKAAAGIIEGMERIRDKYFEIKKEVFTALDIKTMGDNAKATASDFVYFTGVAAASVPVIGGVSLAARGAAGAIDMLAGGFKLLWSPIGWAIIPATALLIAFGNEGENVLDTLTRVAKTTYNAFDALLTPIRWLRKEVGDLGTILTTVTVFKLLQFGLGYGGGVLAAKYAGGKKGAGLAGMLGVQKVFVTNWPPGMMVPGGGIGGVAGGVGGAVVGAAGTAGVGAAGTVAATTAAVGAGWIVAGGIIGTALGVAAMAAIASEKNKAVEAAKVEAKIAAEAKAAEAARLSMMKRELDVQLIAAKRGIMMYEPTQVISALAGMAYKTPEGEVVAGGRVEKQPYEDYMSIVRIAMGEGATTFANEMLLRLKDAAETTPILAVYTPEERQKKIKEEMQRIWTEVPYAKAPEAIKEFVTKLDTIHTDNSILATHLVEIRELLRISNKPVNVSVSMPGSQTSAVRGERPREINVSLDRETPRQGF